MKSIRDYLKSKGFFLLPQNYYRDMKLWEEWWQGGDKEFHKYKIYNGTQYIDRFRAELNAAKMGAEYWANLLWNSDCYITVNSGKEENKNNNVIEIARRLLKKFKKESDDDLQNLLNKVLNNNNFNSNFNELLEKVFAVGNGALVEHDNTIEFIDYENVEVLAYKNKEIESCAFTSYFAHIKYGDCAYLMIHEKQEDDTYIIYNKFFKVNNDNSLAEFSEKEFNSMNVKPYYTVKNKHFFVLKPNISNNKQKKNPLGISVYANCIDVLKMIDLALDGIKTSMEIGRPRVAVNSQGIKTIPNKNGGSEQIPVFDSSEIAFYQFPEGISEGKIIEDITTQYRAGDFEASLEKALMLFSMMLGLGQNAFKWEDGQIKTATEVISENSTMFRAIVKHRLIISDCIVTICKAILEDNKKAFEGIIEVNFDDAILIDKEKEKERGLQLYRDGLIPAWYYLYEYEGYSKEEAEELVRQTKVNNTSVEDLFNAEGAA